MSTATDRGLQCPRCGCEHSEVLRTTAAVRKKRRRRRCRHCALEYYTAERVEAVPSAARECPQEAEESAGE